MKKRREENFVICSWPSQTAPGTKENNMLEGETQGLRLSRPDRPAAEPPKVRAGKADPPKWRIERQTEVSGPLVKGQRNV